MGGAEELTDGVVRAAADGARRDLARVLEALEPQIRLMSAARLCATRGRLDAVDEATQQVLLALAGGIDRLEARTVGGLKAFVSGIVTRKVADLLRQRGEEAGGGRLRSLDSTVAGLSEARLLWQCLSNTQYRVRN